MNLKKSFLNKKEKFLAITLVVMCSVTIVGTLVSADFGQLNPFTRKFDWSLQNENATLLVATTTKVCFSGDGSCMTTAVLAGSGTVSTGTQGQIGYFETGSNTITGTSSIFLDVAGNFGVGTTVPTQKLEIGDGNIMVSNDTATFIYLNDTSNYLRYNGDVWVTSANSARMTAGSGAAIFMQNGSGGKLQVGGTGEAGTDLFINDSGLVGIGTGSPVFLLDVAGTFRSTGAATIGDYTLPNTDGTANYVLKTDGSGAVTWQLDLQSNTSGITFFYDMTSSDVSGYEIIQTSPSEQAELSPTGTSTSSSYGLIDSYISTTTDLTIDVMPAGTYDFHTWASVNNTSGDSRIVHELYKRNTSGTETLIFQATSTELTTSVVEMEYLFTTTASTTFSNERLVIKNYCHTTSGSEKTCTFYYGGSDRYSHFDTPLSVTNLNYARTNQEEIITEQWTFNSGTGDILATTSASSTSILISTSDGGGAIGFANKGRVGISSDGMVNGYDYDGAFILSNQAPSDANGQFIFVEENGSWRFAMPKSGADLGTYNPRSMIIAGPTNNLEADMNCSNWDFNHLDCDTSGTGADLGVQDDGQFKGTLYASSSVITDHLTLPNNDDVATSGSITLDTTSNQTQVFGSAKRVIDEDGIKQMCWSISSSTALLASSTHRVMTPRYENGITFFENYCEMNVGTSMVVNLLDGTNYMDSVTCDTSGATSTASTNNSFDKYEQIFIELEAVTGSPTELNYCGFFRINSN